MRVVEVTVVPVVRAGRDVAAVAGDLNGTDPNKGTDGMNASEVEG